MKSIILADSRKEFIEDASTRVMIAYEDMLLEGASSVEEVPTKIKGKNNAIIAISDSLIEDVTPAFVAAAKKYYPIYGYCADGNNVIRFRNLGVPCLGVIVKTSMLLDKLAAEKIDALSPMTSQPTAQPAQIQPAYPSVNNAQSQPFQTTAVPPQAPSGTGQYIPYQPTTTTPTPVYAPPVQQIPVQPQSPTVPQPTPPVYQQPVQQPPVNPVNQNSITPEQLMAMLQTMMAGQAAPQPAYQPQQQIQPQSETVPVVEPPNQPSAAERISSMHQTNVAERADKEVEADLRKESRHETAVITVYSAKGGVGKTTLSSEIAACLAMTSTGRRKLRVCIVDYNIDFGDVATTLNFNPHGATSALWSAEIKQRLLNGEKSEDIRYTKSEMEDNFLQCCEYGKGNNKIQIYGLIAPTSHEDSMDIGEKELTVMLDNIIQRGEYDFIVCDTGNNTRDSSVLALEKANYVLLVSTQDITTANCNDAFLSTMQKVGFKTDKVYLVVNNIMPVRETGVSVEEVEEVFNQYSCVGRIKRTTDVMQANNKGIPLVFNPDHEYTKQVRKIVRFIVEGETFQEEDDEPVKRGLFGRKKKRK